MGEAVFPSCCLTWGQTMVEVMEIMATSFKRSHAGTATLSAPNTAAGHCPPTPLLEIPRHSWVSLGQFLVGSLLLSPGSWCTQGLVCALQKCVSPVLCNFWWFYGGINGDLLQKDLCHTQVCCTQSRCPCGRPPLTHTSTGDPQTQFWLSLCGLGMSSVPFQGLSSSGDQDLGEHTVPGGPCVLISSPILAAWCHGCATRPPSQVCLMSPLESWSQPVTLLEDVNHPGSWKAWLVLLPCWEPAHGLVEDAVSGTEIAATPWLLFPAVTSLPLCLQVGRGWYSASSPFVFAQSFVLWAGQAAY